MNTSILRVVLSLAPLVIGLPFAMDIYIPAVPHIARMFHVTAGQMQLTLTAFMIIAGIVQLIIGPLSDQFGRKKIIYLMLFIFSLGTLFCASANNLTQLVLYRAIQAIGSCGMMVVAFAMVRDVHEGVKSAKTYSYLNGIIAFSPMFAPFIGSYLDVKFGWPATFLALLVLAVLGFFSISLGLKEPLSAEKRIKLKWELFSQYKKLTLNKTFSIYSFFCAVGLSYLYLFCSISPYIIIRQLHIPELDYGYYFCFMGISFFVGSLISAFIVEKIGVYRTVFFGFFLTLIGGVLMTVWYLSAGLSIDNFIWPMLLIGIGGTFALGAGNGGAMEPFSEAIGAAAALSSAFRFLFAGVLGSFLITSHVTSTLPLAIPAIVFSILGIFVFVFYKSFLK